MTAAGMSMHMAMMNARAASNQKQGDEKPDSGSIWLTEDEIREIRQESAIENNKKSYLNMNQSLKSGKPGSKISEFEMTLL